MKFPLLILLILCNLSFAGWFSFKKNGPNYERLKTGDVVFQDTGGEQGKAVEAATGSKFTHCGIVFEKNDTLYVLEAVQPIQVVTLKDFRKRSKIFHARRLKDPKPLNNAAIAKGLAWGQKQIGKDYDNLFKWDNQNLYCSELVWKIYEKSTGQKLCETQSFKSYFLEKEEVTAIIEKRYGGADNLPADEPVVAPSDLAASPLLVEVPKR